MRFEPKPSNSPLGKNEVPVVPVISWQRGGDPIKNQDGDGQCEQQQEKDIEFGSVFHSNPPRQLLRSVQL